MLMIEIACQALRQRKVLELQYNGFSRSVEVHVCGYTELGHAVLRAWQISGGGPRGEQQGWKLMRLDEASDAQISEQTSEAPRRGFKPGDPAIARIVCEVGPRLAANDPHR